LSTQMTHKYIVILAAVFVATLAILMSVGAVAAQDSGAEEFNETFDRDSFDAWESIAETSDGGYALAGNTGQITAATDDAWLIKTDGNGNTEINKTYGGPETDQVRSVVQTSDGGYALAGRTESFASNGFDAWLIKTDENGNEQFNKTFDREDGDEANSVLQTSDGYALAGTTQSLGSGVGDAWLIETDANGNEQFDKTYGGSGFEAWESIAETSDGGYALAGRTESFGSGGSDAWLVETDGNGNEQFNETYGGSAFETARSVVRNMDGGYTFGGETHSFGPGISSAWLVETDGNGNEQFNKTYGGSAFETARSVVRNMDGGYTFGGETHSFGPGISSAWLVETDGNGNEQFNRTYGGADVDEARSVAEASNGGYALAGFTASLGSGDFDAWLIETDGSGNEEFNQTYGGPAEDVARSVVEAPDGGYALGGSTFSFGSVFDSDAWLVKASAGDGEDNGGGDDSGFSLDDYRNQNGVVDTAGLQQAINDFIQGNIDTGELQAVINAFIQS